MNRLNLAAIAAFAAASTLALPIPAPASAKPRAARCVITTAGSPAYKGPCSFLPDKGGSFSLDPVGRKQIVQDVTMITVWITEPGVAEVSGLTTGGINSRWGEARRSKRDGACWDGSDFRICVY